MTETRQRDHRNRPGMVGENGDGKWPKKRQPIVMKPVLRLRGLSLIPCLIFFTDARRALRHES